MLSPLHLHAVDLLLLDNDERTLRDALEEGCKGAASARIAVAFARDSGVAVAPSLVGAAERGAAVRILAGVDFQLTDLSALAKFDSPPSAARIYLHPDAAARRAFHPKLYLLESPDVVTAIVGSSNLTEGGLFRNVEANLLIRGSPDEPTIARLRSYHTRLWDSTFALPLTQRFREHYDRLQNRRRAADVELRADSDFERAAKDLRLAIAEAITTYPSGRERRAWLLITSPANYIRNIEGRVWGDEQRRRIAQVSNGDLIFFYITHPIKGIGAMGVVIRGVYEDHTPHWPDKRIYPYRFGFTLLLRAVSPVPFRPLVSRLDMYGRRDNPHWGQALQTSMLGLTNWDAEVLRQAVAAGSSEQVVA